MTKVFLATLTPMLTLFFCILVGYVVSKKKLVPDNTATVLSKLETYALVPALTIGTFLKYCTVESLAKYSTLVVYSTIALAVAMAIAIPLSKAFVKNGYDRNVYKYALTFANYGFMGDTLVLSILGEEIYFHYMLFKLPLNIGIYTWGLAILIPAEKATSSAWKRILNPSLISVAVGALIGLSGTGKLFGSGQPLEFLGTALSKLGACMGPVAMVLTGCTVAAYKLPALLSNRKVYIATALRLFILPAIICGILWLFKADDEALKLALIAFATPLGLNTVVFPAAYGGDPSTGASMALISHTLSVLTIPVMYALLNMLIM